MQTTLQSTDGHPGGRPGRQNDGFVGASSASGDVSGSNQVGGLIGYNSGAAGDGVSYTVATSYATGSVSGSSGKGAPAGAGSQIGGLIGVNRGLTTQDYATGSVSGTSQIGGLVGDNYRYIANSYATGAVSGSSGKGALVGVNEQGGRVTDAYATGKGGYGLVGENDGGLAEDYFDEAATGTSVGVGSGSSPGRHRHRRFHRARSGSGLQLCGIRLLAHLDDPARFLPALPDRHPASPAAHLSAPTDLAAAHSAVSSDQARSREADGGPGDTAPPMGPADRRGAGDRAAGGRAGASPAPCLRRPTARRARSPAPVWSRSRGDRRAARRRRSWPRRTAGGRRPPAATAPPRRGRSAGRSARGGD